MADTIDIDALKAKYAEERDKRIRPDGNDQYIEIREHFAHYLEDPYEPVAEREPLTDHVTFAMVGGGFAGLLTAARVKEAGIDDVRIVDKGGDFGGTWYWNRYPGAQCDTASMVYLPLLEETGHMPTEKYAHAPEILDHSRRIGKHFRLYEHALFHTEVTDAEWDDDAGRWIVRTNRGDEFTARYLAMGTGPLHVPKLPGLEGIDEFEGHSFHTSRWDYDYTGGDPAGAPLEALEDQRVAIIGTGATSVQCVPHLARAAKELYVFQRTPSSVDVRGNGPIDPDWFAEIATPGWQQRWLMNFTANQTGGPAEEDLVQDGWTDLARRIRERVSHIPREELTMEAVMEAFEDSDFEKMDEIRARVDEVIDDPAVAADLKAWYRQLCKRPCFHDEYLQAFNRPNCHLVDTDGHGVDRITASGLVAGGAEYEVDCIIYASGFEVGTDHTRLRGFDLTGRSGRRLSQHWDAGMRSMHGTYVNGFPNLFVVGFTQGANLISNVPHNFAESAATIAAVVSHAEAEGFGRVEVTAEAEDAWIELLLSGGGRTLGSPDCTPGYYNNEGHDPGPNAAFSVGYPHGAYAYFHYLDGWRSDGRFDGLAFS
ncbi:MAG: NAD(P)/FAD-dependent oxidoreductase [Actinomycetota bacterium]